MFIMLFALFALELQSLFDFHYAVEVRAQRAVNSIVETSMDDVFRQDGLNCVVKNMVNDIWKDTMDEFLNVDSSGVCRDGNGNLLYTVRYNSVKIGDCVVPGSTDKLSEITSWPEKLQPYIHSDRCEPEVEIELTVRMEPSVGKLFQQDGYTWTNSFKSTNYRTDDDLRKGLFTDVFRDAEEGTDAYILDDSSSGGW